MDRYFLTVDWCCQGKRGIFCDSQGQAFPQETPHTQEEIDRILGPFEMVLGPKSERLSEEQVARCTSWTPLAEYSGVWGIALPGVKP